MSRISPREAVERSRLNGTEDELKQLWISDRVLRLAEYQDVVERVNEQIAELRDVEPQENPYDPKTQPSSYREWARVMAEHPPQPKRIPAMLLKMKIEALRTAAEELGQLPNDIPPQTNDAVYHVVGISQDDLNKLRLFRYGDLHSHSASEDRSQAIREVGSSRRLS